nr:helix-turn-helix domain-containing protein [uncultured Ruegeria sp.]
MDLKRSNHSVSDSGTLQFAHVNEALPHFTGWTMDTVQIETGETASSVLTLDVGALNLVENRESHALVHDWRLGSGTTAFSFFSPRMMDGSWCGHTISAHDFLVATSRRDHFAKTAAGIHQIVLTVGADVLEKSGALPALNGARVLADGSGAVGLTPAGVRLRDFLFQIMRARPFTLHHSEQDLEAEILCMLAEAMNEAKGYGGAQQRLNGSSFSRTVQKAMKALKSDVHLSNASDLAEEIAVSRRTLYRAFQLEMGLSPYKFMLNYRLQKVRYNLLSASANETSVKHVARSNGFSELGRFARYYRAMYGELPRETLS